MAKSLDDVMAKLPKARKQRVEARAMELATLKDLRKATQQTQEQLAATLGVRQDTISRMEKRSDMLLSTLRHYIEGMGGRLDLVAQFPNRPIVLIKHLCLEEKEGNMTKEELDTVINTISKRGDPAYTTPTGALLEYLRTLAQSQDIAGYAEACKLYTDMIPESATFIAARTPGILCNNYFTVLSNFDYQKFERWSLANPEWGNALRKSFSSSIELEAAANKVRISVDEYAD